MTKVTLARRRRGANDSGRLQRQLSLSYVDIECGNAQNKILTKARSYFDGLFSEQGRAMQGPNRFADYRAFKAATLLDVTNVASILDEGTSPASLTPLCEVFPWAVELKVEEAEFDRYVSFVAEEEAVLGCGDSDKSDLLWEWWRGKRRELPTLRKLFFCLCVVSSNSAFCERVFSKYKALIDDGTLANAYGDYVQAVMLSNINGDVGRSVIEG
mmetsp:Transcript_12539/g.46362  ORF Transcript_12539/g.46362 Transcript_12539/m.46362 type:complete len:214 (-) Transcript_12539:41-682(-)